ncbi:DNA-directed RNA polymerase subunit [Quillaja saponaria]|uniref:DNA-directed RNA polymerase n=1 Tax=Quillaja saponaria TaxID=32244 RepID=A0AAD7L6B4_QUISA|nr:DNA-directed RNA polymerase subunit [Quillaja saponaria]
MEHGSYDEEKVPSGLITGIKFDVSTAEDVEKISTITVDAVSEVTDPKLGLPNPSSQCSTCGAKDLKCCEGHFGVIKFPFRILHPYFLSEIAQILNQVCPGCKSVRKDLKVKGADSISRNNQPKGCKYCVASSIGWYPAMRFKVSSADIFRRTAIIVEIVEKLPKKKSFKGVLPADYWDCIPKDEQLVESCLKSNRRVLSHAQVRSLLNDIDPKFVNKFVQQTTLLSLNFFPVTPNCHRVTEVIHALSNGNKLNFDDRTRAYKKLVDFRGVANELSSRVLDCLKISKLNSEKTSGSNSSDIYQRKNSEYTFNTSGLRWIKDVVLGKRNSHSFRMVVVGDPVLKLSEIGVPCQVAENLVVSEYVNRQNKEKLLHYCELRILEKGAIYVRREGRMIGLFEKEGLQIGDSLRRPLNDGDIVLINRPPSIHQHSLIAFSVKVLPITSALSINPLCCSPFRGDFDGDCLHGYIPQSVDARVELNELVSLDKQLINGQSGRNLLSFSQDSLTAAYLLMQDGCRLNSSQIQQLEMCCPHQLPLPAIVKAPSLDSSFWTGKQLFSMLLPPDFNYSFPSNHVSVRDGELLSSSEGSAWLHDTDGNLFLSLVHHCQGESLDFLYAAQEVLSEWLSMRGFSVSLADLYLSSDSSSRKNMMDDILYGLQEAEDACNFKQLMVNSYCDFLSGSNEDTMDFMVERLCYERQISTALSQVSVDAFRQVFRDIQSLVYRYTCKDNSLLAMFKAGSKGNLLKLVQHGMCLGLQHSLVRLSFRFPHQLSCAAWNNQKTLGSNQLVGGTTESAASYIPYAVVEHSFLTGLNPLECFVHSVTSRDSSFSDNADLPGTLTRKLMFFMRDLYVAYDGTVRNSYGNQLIQFSYDTEKESSSSSSSQDLFDESSNAYDKTGGQPVGSLSACAISEAAYSALDQPVSLLEKSPLLNLKNVLECGSRKRSCEQTVSLFLCDKLGIQRHGFEYGALEVKNHLERLMLSDIVSTIMITFSPQTCNQTQFSPWVCHFHVNEETMKRRKLKVHSIIKSIYQKCDSLKESRISLPSLHISSKNCFAAVVKNSNDTLCITVTLVENSKNSSIQLDAVRDFLIPILLSTVVKGFQEIMKVDILWNNRSKVSKSSNDISGELYLRVTMSGDCGNTGFWGALKNDCLQIMHMIDWTRSHPDNIHHFSLAYGIDAGWKYFLKCLEFAISDTGKTILPQHLLLVANSLSVTGEFVGLNAKGIARQRECASVTSPFVQACLSNPGACFIKAAKAGVTDDLQGSLDALAWGNCPSMGTGGQFDIIYSGKGCELDKPADVYNLLQISSDKHSEKISTPDAQDYVSDTCGTQFRYRNGGSASFLKSFWTANDIRKLARESKCILHKYPINHQLSEVDKSIVMRALSFHPHRIEKSGSGVRNIKIGFHPKYQNSRCFLLDREDGTVEDFSIRKCILGALEIIAPETAKNYQKKWLEEGSKAALG